MEQNSLRTSDNTGIAPSGHIDGYWHLPYGEFPIQSLEPKRRQSSLSSKTFPEVFGWVLGKKREFVWGGIKGSLFGLLFLTCRVGYCIPAAVDVALASGASIIYFLIAGSFII